MTSKCPITGEVYYLPKNINRELMQGMFTPCSQPMKDRAKQLSQPGALSPLNTRTAHHALIHATLQFSQTG